MKVLLEHKKRKPKSGIPDHPDYIIHASKTRDGSRYNAYHRATGTSAGTLFGSYNAKAKDYHVNWAGASDSRGSEMDYHAGTAMRKAGKHNLPANLTHHVLKHIKKDFPAALRMTATRVSGANPMHHVDVPLRRITPKEKSKISSFNQHGSIEKGKESPNHHIIRMPGLNAVTHVRPATFGAASMNKATLGTLSNVKKAVRLVKATGKFKSLKVNTGGAPQHEFVFNKPKKSTVVLHKHPPENMYYPDDRSYEIKHSRHGSLGGLHLSKMSNHAAADLYPNQRSKATRILKNMTFGEKRRIYRIIKDKVVPEMGHTALHRSSHHYPIAKIIKSKKAFR